MNWIITLQRPPWLTTTVISTVVVAIMLLLFGMTAPRSPLLALAVAVVVLVVCANVADPAAIPVLGMPLLVIVLRVGGASVNLTISDVALAAASCAALVLAPRPFSPPLRTLLWLTGTYQVATLFTVVANPYLANTVEWFHSGMLVAGGLVMGWAVGRSGHGRIGLTLLLVPCLLIAVLTLAQSAVQLLSGSTGPVYLEWPYGMHKNFIGPILAMACLILHANPPWVGWRRGFTVPAFVLCTLGVVASQARQALVGLAIALTVVVLRRMRGRRHSPLIIVGSIVALAYAVSAAADQLASGNEFNSAYQRISWYQDAMEVWSRSPWFGVGLRWWTAGRTEFGFQPPNAEIEVLSSAGILGLLGFIILMAGALAVLWRLDPRFGTLAFSIILMRLVQGQLDLYWVAVQVSVPFVVAGLCLGAEALHEAEHPDDVVPARHSARRVIDRIALDRPYRPAGVSG